VRWTHDPDNLVPSTVTDPFAFVREFPDEQAVESRPDVLTFTAESIRRPLDLARPVRLRVHIGSTAGSMHLHAKLSDVAPDGSTHMLVRGQAHVQDPDLGAAVEIALGAHRLPASAWAPAAGAPGLQRLPPLHLAPRNRREPLACDRRET